MQRVKPLGQSKFTISTSSHPNYHAPRGSRVQITAPLEREIERCVEDVLPAGLHTLAKCFKEIVVVLEWELIRIKLEAH